MSCGGVHQISRTTRNHGWNAHPSHLAKGSTVNINAAHISPLRSPVVAVMGTTGGTWASTLASACAGVVAARDPWLIETTPWGTLETLLGLESAAGLRWSDLAEVSGEIDTNSLKGLAIKYAGISVLPFGHHTAATVKLHAISSVLHSMSTQGQTCILDSSPHDLEWLPTHISHLVLVTPLTLLGLSGTLKSRRMAQDAGLTVGIASTESRPPELTPKQFEKALGSRIAGHLPKLPANPNAVLHGMGPLGGPHRATQRLLGVASQVLEELGIHGQ